MVFEFNDGSAQQSAPPPATRAPTNAYPAQTNQSQAKVPPPQQTSTPAQQYSENSGQGVTLLTIIMIVVASVFLLVACVFATLYFIHNCDAANYQKGVDLEKVKKEKIQLQKDKNNLVAENALLNKTIESGKKIELAYTDLDKNYKALQTSIKSQHVAIQKEKKEKDLLQASYELLEKNLVAQAAEIKIVKDEKDLLQTRYAQLEKTVKSNGSKNDIEARKELALLQKEYEKVAKINKDLTINIERVATQKDDEISELNKKHEEHLSAIGTLYQKAKEDYKKTKEDEIVALKKIVEQKEQLLLSSNEKVTQSASTQIANLKTEHNAAVEKLTREHTQKIANLESQIKILQEEKEIKSSIATSSDASKKQLEALTAQLTAEKKDLENKLVILENAKKSLQEQKDQVDQTNKKLSDQLSASLATLQGDKKVTQDIQTQINDLNAFIKEKDNAIQEKNTQIEQYKSEIGKLSEKVNKAIAAQESLKNGFENEKNKIYQTYQAELKNVKINLINQKTTELKMVTKPISKRKIDITLVNENRVENTKKYNSLDEAFEEVARINEKGPQVNELKLPEGDVYISKPIVISSDISITSKKTTRCIPLFASLDAAKSPIMSVKGKKLELQNIHFLSYELQSTPILEVTDGSLEIKDCMLDGNNIQSSAIQLMRSQFKATKLIVTGGIIGISLTDCNNVTLSEILISNTVNKGLFVNNCKNLKITKSIISHNQEYAIDLQSSELSMRESSITDNQLKYRNILTGEVVKITDSNNAVISTVEPNLARPVLIMNTTHRVDIEAYFGLFLQQNGLSSQFPEDRIVEKQQPEVKIISVKQQPGISQIFDNIINSFK